MRWTPRSTNWTVLGRDRPARADAAAAAVCAGMPAPEPDAQDAGRAPVALRWDELAGRVDADVLPLFQEAKQ
jgi:hypothetical protein